MSMGDKMKYSTKDLYLARLAKVEDVVDVSYGAYRTYYKKLDNYVFVRYDGLYYYDIFTKTKYRDLSHYNEKGTTIICDMTPIAVNKKKISKEVLESIVRELNPNVLIIKESPLQNIKQRLLGK